MQKELLIKSTSTIIIETENWEYDLYFNEISGGNVRIL